MKIISLVENTSTKENYGTEHGLSLYIEWQDKKLLFDTGASDLFLRNAKQAGVDISDVDALILSHGHDDHGGGLETFLHHNLKAKIYMQKEAFGQYLSASGQQVEYIGLDQKLKDEPRIVYCEGRTEIYPGCTIFDGVTGRRFFSPANKTLLQRKGVDSCDFEPDEFVHEQYLVLEENAHRVLLGGCCHNGIVNVVDKAIACNMRPDVVISGFHFLHMSIEKSSDFVDLVSKELQKHAILYYTCHCTGKPCYERMKENMGDQIEYLACGDEIEI